MHHDLTNRIWAEADALVTAILPLLVSEDAARSVVRAAESAIPAIMEDLDALAHRDSAARDNPFYVWNSYLSFRAVLAYRIAHAILEFASGEALTDPGMVHAARRMTEHAKAQTGVDIHPAARIGHRMVIDHGWGTVIGEQARVGDDCYFLQNVTLGCRRIGKSYTPGERRHPTIGNRVILAGDVWVFGPVTIGDDCRVDPGARIIADVPAGAHVRVITKLQLTEPAVP